MKIVKRFTVHNASINSMDEDIAPLVRSKRAAAATVLLTSTTSSDVLRHLLVGVSTVRSAVRSICLTEFAPLVLAVPYNAVYAASLFFKIKCVNAGTRSVGDKSAFIATVRTSDVLFAMICFASVAFGNAKSVRRTLVPTIMPRNAVRIVSVFSKKSAGFSISKHGNNTRVFLLTPFRDKSSKTTAAAQLCGDALVGSKEFRFSFGISGVYSFRGQNLEF